MTVIQISASKSETLRLRLRLSIALDALRQIETGLANTGSTPGEWLTTINKPTAYEIARAALARASS